MKKFAVAFDIGRTTGIAAVEWDTQTREITWAKSWAINTEKPDFSAKFKSMEDTLFKLPLTCIWFEVPFADPKRSDEATSLKRDFWVQFTTRLHREGLWKNKAIWASVQPGEWKPYKKLLTKLPKVTSHENDAYMIVQWGIRYSNFRGDFQEL